MKALVGGLCDDNTKALVNDDGGWGCQKMFKTGRPINEKKKLFSFNRKMRILSIT